jgi:hypothetical protein
VQEPLSELEKDAANLLFALHDAWPYVHRHCTIESKKKTIQALMVKHRDFADLQPPAAQPVQKPVAWHDKIIGMEVSMDVSTGEDDIDHRVYGQVYEVMLAYDGGPDVILAIESERNFTTPPATPVPLTDGVTVPLEVLEAAEESLGSFCSDHGWGDRDMQNMDNLPAYIARHKAAHHNTKKGQP